MQVLDLVDQEQEVAVDDHIVDIAVAKRLEWVMMFVDVQSAIAVEVD